MPGIYYRRPIAHRVHVVQAGKDAAINNYQLANGAPIFQVDIDRTAFVTRETTIAFDGGALTSVRVQKDSEALAVALLPVKIMDAMIDGTIDAITQRKKLVDAESDYLKSLALRNKAEADLPKSQQSSSSPGRSGNAGSNINPTGLSLTDSGINGCIDAGIIPSDTPTNRAVCAARRGK